MPEQIRVLVADDHRFYREGVRTLLASEPDIVVVGEAANGEEAVERANELEPDVILMDLKMPGLNGIDAMRILRSDPSTAHIPVVALSANAVPRDIQKGMDAGFFDYVTKPFKVQRLLAALDAALAHASAPNRLNNNNETTP